MREKREAAATGFLGIRDALDSAAKRVCIAGQASVGAGPSMPGAAVGAQPPEHCQAVAHVGKSTHVLISPIVPPLDPADGIDGAHEGGACAGVGVSWATVGPKPSHDLQVALSDSALTSTLVPGAAVGAKPLEDL